MIFMAECFTFRGRELSWATSRTRHQTSFSCCCRLLSSSCRFRSLSTLSWGLSRLETKKKTRSTRHQFEPKALSIFFACMLQISADHLSDALSCALHFCSVLFPFVLYPILLPGILASARCQQAKLIFKMAKGGLKGVRAFSGCTSFDRNPLHVLLGFSDNHDNFLSLHALEQRGHQSLTCSALVCSRWVLRLIRWSLHRACIRLYQSFCGS